MRRQFASFLVMLAGAGLLGLVGGCSPISDGDAHVGATDAALTAEQCDYFDVKGKVHICHKTGSVSHPYTIIRVSEQACINAHSAHDGDYITSLDPASPLYDPTCSGQGCLSVNAPCDATLPCCDGLSCQSGTCVDVDECAAGTDNCSDNATCTNTVGGFTCACNPGYEGDGVTCTNIDECAANPCQNGGICTDGVNSYTCTCPPGYSGTNCEINIDECAPNPCQNGGTCTDGVNSYTCACAPGYSGANCEINIDECAPNPCQNGGTCTDGVNSYTCACPAGYSGTNCEINVSVRSVTWRERLKMGEVRARRTPRQTECSGRGWEV